MAELAIFIPTYKRPHRLEKLVKNLEETTRSDFSLYWGVEPEDDESIEKAESFGHPVILNEGHHGYSDTVQTMYEQTSEPIIFVANDDFLFTDGWDVGALAKLNKNPDIMVLAVDDGMEYQRFTTIFFFRRSYVAEQSGVIDIPNRVFYPYNHNYQDTEFCQTAQKRGVWDKLEGPCIIHLRLPMDETYQKNNATFHLDSVTYNSRLPFIT